jgi:NtrC-family two-component system response regulator AlgB
MEARFSWMRSGKCRSKSNPSFLRLLQEREYERVGEARVRRAQVRVVAATNRNLAEEVKAGRFREDLYYRLNVISVTLPGLRDRPSDLRRLAESYLVFFAQKLGRPTMTFSPEVASAFSHYGWPGNLRELRNVVERAVILARGDSIQPDDLPDDFRVSGDMTPMVGARVTLDELEAAHIRRIVATSRNLDDAAKVLGIDPATLYRKRQKLGLASG